MGEIAPNATSAMLQAKISKLRYSSGMPFMIGSTSQTHLVPACFPILVLQVSMDNMSNLISLSKIYFWLSDPEPCSVDHNRTP